MDTAIVQRTGNGVVSTKATQVEVKELENEKASTVKGDASKSREVILNGRSREPPHEFIGMIFNGIDLHVQKLLSMNKYLAF